MNIGIIVTARVQSSRLKEKVLQKINGKYSIEILLDHLSNRDYPVILAIPENKQDDKLKEIAESKGVQVYRGDDDSPLHRLYNCALEFGFDHVVRITADDILIDKWLMLRQIEFHLGGNLDYTFMRKCPEGTAGEVIRVDVLEEVANESEGAVEFISYYLKKPKFRYKEYYPPREYQYTYRLTMDYPEDLTLLRVLHSSLRNNFGTLDLINFLDQNKYYLQINHLPLVTVYTCNHNTSGYIRDCMESVYNQTFTDYEFIILDDCSTDDSCNVILEYVTNESKKNKTKVLRNKKNIGLPASCNKVIEKARGKYIIRIDSDDTFEPNAIERMVDTIREEDVQGVFTGYNETKAALSITASILEDRHHPAGCLLSRWCVNELRYKEDLEFEEGKEFFERFDEQYQTTFLKEVLWNYRQREGQKTKNLEHPNVGRNKTG